MYGELVYRIGKKYTQARKDNPSEEFPYFSGKISDLVPDAVGAELPDLEGEYVIAYDGLDGVKHLIRVYFDDDTYEATGTDDNLDGGFSFTSHIA